MQGVQVSKHLIMARAEGSPTARWTLPAAVRTRVHGRHEHGGTGGGARWGRVGVWYGWVRGVYGNGWYGG